MVKATLRYRGWILSLLLALTGLNACSGERRVGMILEWRSEGGTVFTNYETNRPSRRKELGISMVVSRRSSAQETYTPDASGRLPEWIEVEWLYPIDERHKISHEEGIANARRYVKRFYLRQIIPSKVIEELENGSGKFLKLIFIFRNEALEMRYEIKDWNRPEE